MFKYPDNKGLIFRCCRSVHVLLKQVMCIVSLRISCRSLFRWETVAFLDFQHSFVAEKETSEREWDLTIRSGLKPHRALVGNIERVLLRVLFKDFQ